MINQEREREGGRSEYVFENHPIWSMLGIFRETSHKFHLNLCVFLLSLSLSHTHTPSHMQCMDHKELTYGSSGPVTGWSVCLSVHLSYSLSSSSELFPPNYILSEALESIFFTHVIIFKTEFFFTFLNFIKDISNFIGCDFYFDFLDIE